MNRAIRDCLRQFHALGAFGQNASHSLLPAAPALERFPPQMACRPAANPFRRRNSLNSFRDSLGRNTLTNRVR